MKIVVVGDGKVGATLVSQLVKEGHDVTVIDNNAAVLRRSTDTMDVLGIHGNGASYAIQREAGVQDADLLIAATSADELNILSCMLAKKLGAEHTSPGCATRKIGGTAYHASGGSWPFHVHQSRACRRSGDQQDHPVSLSHQDGFLRQGTGGTGGDQDSGKQPPSRPVHGLYLPEIQRKNPHLRRTAERRGIHPSGDFVLQQGDKITLTGVPREIEDFFRTIGVLKEKVKSALIVGGGRITFYLGRILSKMGVKVKIIERNPDRCQQLSVVMPKATLICGDGTDEELLLEEGIADTDAFIALIDNDEENIIISMYATSLGVNKVITKVNRLSFAGIMERAGIDSVISPKFITADQIVRYVRAMQNSLGSNVETLHKIVDNKVEAVEFVVREKAKFLGTPLKNLELKPNLLLACIIRKGKHIIPSGDDTMELGDSVLVITSTWQLKDLKDILA